MDNNMNKEKNDVESLFKFMTDIFFGRKNNLHENTINQLYNSINEMLSKQESKDSREPEKFMKMRHVINSFFALIRNPEVLEEIKSTNITKIDFMQKYREKVLGDGKRKYGMSDLYDSGLIAKANKWSDRKKIEYIPSVDQVEYEFYDSKHRKVKINIEGELNYEGWNAVQSSLTEYRVEREGENGHFKEYSILSNIIIPKMEDSQYRKAVLDELLSENNIMLANCGGYVGEIIESPMDTKEELPYMQTQDRYRYTYRIDDKYELEYDAANVSASMDYAAQKHHQMENSNIINIKDFMKDGQNKDNGKTTTGKEYKQGETKTER